MILGTIGNNLSFTKKKIACEIIAYKSTKLKVVIMLV